jgi:hypothetical protein
VKLLALPAVGLVVGLLSFPILFASGDAPLAQCGQPGSLAVVLLTIRSLESGGDYTAEAAGSTASGAYQFLDSSWAGYGGYQRASDAPPAVQDAKAAELVTSVLERYGGDISAVPVVWYIGHVPPDGSTVWDTVPAPQAGNTLTPREYQIRWLDEYDEIALASSPATAPSSTPPDAAGCLPGLSITPLGDGWAFPAPADLFAGAPVDSPHHDYPAWDWMLPVGTPLYAVRGGTVTTVQYWPHNWWDFGCGAATQGCSTCGIGVTVADADGNRWAYCHGSAAHVTTGQEVAAGAQLLSSGNTGRSSGPHLHLQIRTSDGVLRCPQPLVRSLRDQQRGLDPNGLPTTGCIF